MSNYKLVSTLVECGVKLSKNDDKERVNQTFFQEFGWKSEVPNMYKTEHSLWRWTS